MADVSQVLSELFLIGSSSNEFGKRVEVTKINLNVYVLHVFVNEQPCLGDIYEGMD
jgi:hypothetical protein